MRNQVLAILLVAFGLYGCSTVPQQPQPQLSANEVNQMISNAVKRASANQPQVDINAIVNAAVEKANAETAAQIADLKKNQTETQPVVEDEQPTAIQPISVLKAMDSPSIAHPMVELKREIRNCTLELLMYDTHVADATDACLRIYRSRSYMTQQKRNGHAIPINHSN